jgi:hypothetical protein
MGIFEIRYIPKQERIAKTELKKHSKNLVDSLDTLSKDEWQELIRSKTGQEYVLQANRRTPPLEKDEFVVAIEDPEPIHALKSSYQDARGGKISSEEQAIELTIHRVLKAAGKRAPFHDLEKSDFLVRRSKDPYSKESSYMEDFPKEIIHKIETIDDFESFLPQFQHLVGDYRIKLPYFIKHLFFSTSEDYGNLGREIQKKYGEEARKLVSDYVEENTDDSVEKLVRLLTLSGEGIIEDWVSSDEQGIIKIDPAKYLLASRHYIDSKKPS